MNTLTLLTGRLGLTRSVLLSNARSLTSTSRTQVCQARYHCILKLLIETNTKFASVRLERPSLHSNWYHSVDKTESYAHGASDVPLLHATLGQVLRFATASTPDQDVFIFPHEGVRKTYAEFLEDVERCAWGMVALGLKRGDRVGIWGPNAYEWVIAQFATALVGMILVNVNPAYQANELKFCLNKVGVRMLIMSAKFKTQDYYTILQQAMPSLGHASRAGALNDPSVPSLEHIVMFGADEPSPGAWHFDDDLMCAADAQSKTSGEAMEAKIRHRPDIPVNIQFTSEKGTTGSPKGATLSHHNIVNNAYFIGRRQHMDRRRHIICCCPPLYHCFGCVAGSLASVVHNGTCVFPAPSFEPEPSLKAVEDEKCTALYGTPTMFIDMVNHPNVSKYNYDSLETGVMSGAPCPSQLCTDLIYKMTLSGFTLGYGSTETSPVTFQSLREDDPMVRVTNAGTIHPHIEAIIADPDGVTVPLGERGELYTRGYTTMLGYWADEEKTQEVITEDRWYKTGDQAVMDAEGRVMIVGRSKECIIRGGENIYPAEIEEFLFKHPLIDTIQVFGVPDERMGEAVCAWVVVKNGEQLTHEDIATYCRGKISHFKIPQYIQLKHIEDFPVTVTGKFQKFRMRELAVQELGLDKIKSHFG